MQPQNITPSILSSMNATHFMDDGITLLMFIKPSELNGRFHGIKVLVKP